MRGIAGAALPEEKGPSSESLSVRAVGIYNAVVRSLP